MSIMKQDLKRLDNIAKAHANEIENSDKGELAFNSMMRLMDKIDPSYKD